MNYFQQYIKYIKDNPNKLWFKRKLYGWGWTPVTWQGWLITILYIMIIMFFSLTIDTSSSFSEIFFPFILPTIVSTALFFRILYKKGEKPHWQWGLKE